MSRAPRWFVAGFMGLVAAMALGLRGAEDPYTVTLVLPNASGLKEGSEVRLGGTEIGSVSDLRLDSADRVVVTLSLDERRGPVGRDASAAIATRNLLGQKYVDLDPGTRSRPVPSGSVIARSAVSTPTDLDQVLDVLDSDTRTRLQILINEAGVAMMDRKADFNSAVRLLPPSVVQLDRVLNSLRGDSHTLGHLVTDSDRLLASIARERKALGALVASAGAAATTVAARRAELAETLDRAPRTLDTAQRFLADLRSAAAPLGPAATKIAQTAPPLTAALRELAPVRAAAEPAFDHAVAAAPALTRLGTQATPVLAGALPTVNALADLSNAAPPLTRTLDASVDDLLSTLHGWALAIQTRDGLSHSFRVRATISTDAVLTLAQRLERLQGDKRTAEARGRTQRDPARRTPRPEGAAKTPPRRPSAGTAVDKVKGAVGDAVGRLTGKPGSDTESGSNPRQLLDFLLGP